MVFGVNWTMFWNKTKHALRSSLCLIAREQPKRQCKRKSTKQIEGSNSLDNSNTKQSRYTEQVTRNNYIKKSHSCVKLPKVPISYQVSKENAEVSELQSKVLEQKQTSHHQISNQNQEICQSLQEFNSKRGEETEQLTDSVYLITNEDITSQSENRKENSKHREENTSIVTDFLSKNSVRQQFETLGNVYSTATGSFEPTWNTDVNLGPPRSYQRETPDGDLFIMDYYNSLQYTLLETGYPETQDRTGTPRLKHSDERVSIAVMASACECVGLLLKGGEEVSDAFHLILSPSWLSQSQSTKNPSLKSLYVHKAITFHKGGYSYIDEFDTPRRVTYFINFFTNNITAGQRSDGEHFEVDIDCPISSPVQLSEIVDNKVWTRNIMADVGMAIPETLVFVYKPKIDIEPSTDKIQVVHVSDTNGRVIDENVRDFLATLGGSNDEMVVVKPSGPSVYGSMGVSYHHRQEVTSVCEAVNHLLTETEAGGAVLVERFIKMGARERQPGHKAWFADDRHNVRIRATVCRDFNDEPRTTMINCGIALKTDPINGDNTITQSLDSTLVAFGVTDVRQRRKLDAQIRKQCEDVLRRIIQMEKQFDQSERGAAHGQTDVIGIDLCLEDDNGRLEPVGIEVNSHDCLINCQIYESVQSLFNRTVPQTAGTATRPRLDGTTTFSSNCDNAYDNAYDSAYDPWIRTMLVRSQLYLMQNKVVLVIGAGGYSKRFVWSESGKYGIKIILVDDDHSSPVKDQVYQYIKYDFSDHTHDQHHAEAIARIIQDSNIEPDGCLTFWEDCGPLAALVREKLGLSQGASYQAALNAKKKSRTQDLLRTRTDDIPHWPRAYLYSSMAHHVDSRETLDKISVRLDYPAMLKLEHGSSAVGVTLVNDQSELKEGYTQTSKRLQCEADFPGIGLGHDNSMVVTQYHYGSEHDVDIVMFDRRLVAAFISDNGPTRLPLFTETVALMPSSLPRDKQAQLVTAAYQCCTEIGLTSGTFNVELKMTATGPKLIEINARMGGFYLRDWIKRLYNVDSMMMSLMISCNVKPYVPKRTSMSYVAGVMLLPSLHADVLSSDKTKSLIEKGKVILNVFSETTRADSKDFEEPFANIAVEGASIVEVKQKLLRVCEDLNISSEKYVVSDFLKEF